MRIRDANAAAPADLAAITAIYAHHVRTGTGTFEEDAPGRTCLVPRLRFAVRHSPLALLWPPRWTPGLTATS